MKARSTHPGFLGIPCILAFWGLVGGCAAARTETARPAPELQVKNTPGSTAKPVLQGRIADERGRAVPDATVILFSGVATRWESMRTKTDADGHYRFDPVQVGSLTQDDKSKDWSYYIGVRLEHPEFTSADGLSWWDLVVPTEPGTVATRDWVMTPGGTLEGILISGANDCALPGVGLRIMIPDPRDGTRFLRYTTTDNEGRFRESGLFPGEYMIDRNDHPYPVVGHATVAAGRTSSTRLTLNVAGG